MCAVNSSGAPPRAPDSVERAFLLDLRIVSAVGHDHQFGGIHLLGKAIGRRINELITGWETVSARITAAKVRKWLYDPRLTKTP